MADYIKSIEELSRACREAIAESAEHVEKWARIISSIQAVKNGN